MTLTPRVALEVAHHEAVVRQAYKDNVGVWTWSVGLTNATGHVVTRYIDNPQTLDRCLEVFLWALQNYADAVRAEFAGHALTEAEFAAALSFHWNTGAIRSATWPDLWKAGRIEAAEASMMEWRKPASIIGRRTAEADLFFRGQWSGARTMPEYTRVTAGHTPVWSSRVEVDVEHVIRAILDAADQGEAAPGKPEATTPTAVVAKSPEPDLMEAALRSIFTTAQAAINQRK